MVRIVSFPKRPRVANWAVWLLYLAACLGIVKYVLLMGATPDDASVPIAQTFRLALELAVWLLFTFFAGIGFRWSCYVIVLVVGLNAFGAVYGVAKGLIPADLFLLATNAMQVVGAVLLFTRQSSQWFAAMRIARKELKANMKADRIEEAGRRAERKAQTRELKERQKSEKNGSEKTKE